MQKIEQQKSNITIKYTVNKPKLTGKTKQFN